MPLFADTAASDGNQVVLLAQIVVGGLMTVASGYFTLRANSAVKTAEDKATGLEARVAQNERSIKECESDRGTLRIDNNKLRDYVGLLYRTMHELVGDLRGVQDREADRHPEVPPPRPDLHARLAQLPPPPPSCVGPDCPLSDTGEHTPV